MKQVLLVAMIAVAFVGCVNKGYVPHYIVTDSKEPKSPRESLVTEPSNSATSTLKAH